MADGKNVPSEEDGEEQHERFFRPETAGDAAADDNAEEGRGNADAVKDPNITNYIGTIERLLGFGSWGVRLWHYECCGVCRR